MIEAFAVARFQPGSAKKLTLIADLIRGKDVTTALRTLTFLVKPSKAPVLKTPLGGRQCDYQGRQGEAEGRGLGRDRGPR
jgi:ribosomal protein L22